MSEHVQLGPDRHESAPPVPRAEGHEDSSAVLHESDAFDFRAIFWSGVGLAVFILAVSAFLVPFLGGLERYHAARVGNIDDLVRDEAGQPFEQRAERVPAPRLEGIERLSSKKESRGIAAARAEAEKQMKNYGWIDRQKEIAHVPVEKAMEQILNSGELAPAKHKKNKAGAKQ